MVFWFSDPPLLAQLIFSSRTCVICSINWSPVNMHTHLNLVCISFHCPHITFLGWSVRAEGGRGCCCTVHQWLYCHGRPSSTRTPLVFYSLPNLLSQCPIPSFEVILRILVMLFSTDSNHVLQDPGRRLHGSLPHRVRLW